jgi:hypothetical protein
MSDDILARLREMAGSAGEPKVEAKPKAVAPKAAKPKAEPAPVAVVEPEPVTEPVPGFGVAKSAVLAPVVVLDDGTTFSNLRGAKVCWVSPDAEEIEESDLDCGIEIGDLLTLRDAVQTILRIVG